MVVFGLLGLLRCFPSLIQPFMLCLSEQISSAMAILWVSTTAPFSSFLESVVSANSAFLIVITVKSMVYGRNNLRLRVVFIILSMGWCVFASILGVFLSKVEWRYLYRILIFLLVMEGNRYRILFKIALGIAEYMEFFEAQDCTVCMVHMVLMEETHGVWNYMLSMEKKGMRITKNLASKRLCDYVEEIYGAIISDFGTEALVPLCLHFRVTCIHIGFKVTVCKNKVQPNDAASKSYPRKANMKLDTSRVGLLLYFSQSMAHTCAYVIICVCNSVIAVITL